MALVLNFEAVTSNPNSIALTWDQPAGFNLADSDIIVTRTTSHFPCELFNTDQGGKFEGDATDPRGVEIFRGTIIPGLNPGTVSVVGSTLTDTSATFPTSPSLAGRLLRDSNSVVYTIVSNTATTITVEYGSPAVGIYIVLADFPTVILPQWNFITDPRTTAGLVATGPYTGYGYVNNLVYNNNGALLIATFIPSQLTNSIFIDSSGNRYLILDNTINTIYFFQMTTPVISGNMYLLSNFVTNPLVAYIDTFLNAPQAAARLGTGLLDDTFYYYTAFDQPIGTNVAQAAFSIATSNTSTQSADISTKNTNFGTTLYNLWPSLYQELDTTEDLQDLMNVFGYQFNQLHSYIKTFNLQDCERVFHTALLYLSGQTGLPTVGYSLGIDTLRRIANNIIPAYELKGSKQGIALFIRILTTWDITNGTGNFSAAIVESTSVNQALTFWSNSLGEFNTMIADTGTTTVVSATIINIIGNTIYLSSPVTGVVANNVFNDLTADQDTIVISADTSTNSVVVESTYQMTIGDSIIITTGTADGGLFVSTLPGVIIPGFFNYREFIITISHVALFVGTTTSYSFTNNTTTVTDSTANFGPTNGLVDNFLLANQENPNGLYQIISNTSTSVTVQGILNNPEIQTSYAILSPLNTNRFISLLNLLPLFIPVKTVASFIFT